jgi:hypothetical protein
MVPIFRVCRKNRSDVLRIARLAYLIWHISDWLYYGRLKILLISSPHGRGRFGTMPVNGDAAALREQADGLADGIFPSARLSDLSHVHERCERIAASSRVFLLFSGRQLLMENFRGK